MNDIVSPGQTVFARWSDGYYYPATVDEVLGDHIKASFLDGDTGLVAKEHVVELQEAFETMHFQGNWQYEGFFFKGVLSSQLPMIMNYNDGDVEQIELGQLRGTMPKPKPNKETAEPPISAKEYMGQLKSLYKAGLLTKEEYKRRKNLL